MLGTLAQTSPVATGSMGMHQPTGTGAAVFGPHLHTHTSSRKLRILAGRSFLLHNPANAPRHCQSLGGSSEGFVRARPSDTAGENKGASTGCGAPLRPAVANSYRHNGSARCSAPPLTYQLQHLSLAHSVWFTWALQPVATDAGTGSGSTGATARSSAAMRCCCCCCGIASATPSSPAASTTRSCIFGGPRHANPPCGSFPPGTYYGTVSITVTTVKKSHNL